MLNSKTLGNKIIQARKKANLTQAELAQQVSISPQAVGKWERGESMPDVSTLNRLAEILRVDLNYFSDSFQTATIEIMDSDLKVSHNTENSISSFQKITGWNMSKGNWLDADFSGLKNLTEKFSSSNMKNCRFIRSGLSGLKLANNNIELCDFTSSNLQQCTIQSSNLLNNQFKNCSFIDTKFLKSNIGKCDFSEADLSGVKIISGYVESIIINNAVIRATIFKDTGISDVVFEGILEECQFENCSFYGVKFQNATILNTFFKNNRKFKKVEFINCKVDKISYAFLKNNQANLAGIEIIE